MKKLLATGFLVLSLPFFTSAATITELQAQLQVLMAQIAALQTVQGSTAAPQSGAAAASCPNLSRNLFRSTRGTDVTQLQQFLISQNLLAADNATGFFGAMTEGAVKQFQCKNMSICSGSPASNGYGSVGPRTRAAIVAKCTGSVTPPVTPSQCPIVMPPECSNGTLISLGVNANGCSLGFQCKPKSTACPDYQRPICPAGQYVESGVLGANGCYGAPRCVYDTVVIPTNQSCTFNGQTIAHGQSVTAYQSTSVPAGQSCVSVQRTCTNGTLSGTYTYASCSISSTALERDLDAARALSVVPSAMNVQGKKIVFWGDSLTQYLGTSVNSIFPGATVYNYGVSGDIAAHWSASNRAQVQGDGSTRSVSFQNMVTLRPDIIFVRIGINDLVQTSFKDSYGTNLDAFVSAIHTSLPSAQIILLPLLPVDENPYAQTLRSQNPNAVIVTNSTILNANTNIVRPTALKYGAYYLYDAPAVGGSSSVLYAYSRVLDSSGIHENQNGVSLTTFAIGYLLGLPVNRVATQIDRGTPTSPLVQTAQNSGWDYDLAKKCVRTTGSSGDANYFALTDQCGGGGKQWSVAVESENAPGASAPGPANRSFLINGPDSPVTMNWFQHSSELGPNWSVNMKTDFITHPHPNGDGYFTWFALMDHAGQGGGPLPAPQNLVSEHRIGYNSHVPFPDASSRLMAAAQFYYGGKAHLLEINLAMTQWGDGHPDPEAIIVRNDWLGDGALEYVTLDGAALGLTITPTVEATIRIPWGDILAHVIEKGWFAPIGNQSSVTQAVYIATETKNKAITDLWHTNFRVSSE